MGIPVKYRWWLVTILIVGTLLLISSLALDRPNVVWEAFKPHCPHCRHEVAAYSHRCADCNSEFDWTATSGTQSPISTNSLSVLEAEWVHGRVKELGLEPAAARVAKALGLTDAAATEFLQNVGRGDCGLCGGSKKDLASEDLAKADVCPCCFGSGDSVTCGGDRRVRVGDPIAHRALLDYKATMADLMRGRAVTAPGEVAKEARRLAEAFLTIHAGTAEAAEIVYWKDIDQPVFTGDGQINARRAVSAVGRERLNKVLEALQSRP